MADNPNKRRGDVAEITSAGVIAGLQQQLQQVTAEREALTQQLQEVTAERDALTQQQQEVTAERDTLTQQLQQQQEQINQLQKQQRGNIGLGTFIAADIGVHALGNLLF